VSAATLIHRYNLRDYGGYTARGGARLRRGVLFRSGQLDECGLPEQGLLEGLGVSAIVDLRGPAEVPEGSSPAYHGWSGTKLFATSEDHLVPHAMRELAAVTSTEGVVAHMASVYRKLPFSERFRESMRNYVSALDGVGSDGSATLVHCFAGKDRTGIAVALFHLLAGVHRDDVFADYLMTNAMGEERIALGLPHLARRANGRAPEWLLREVMAARAEYLEAALDEFAQRNGGPTGYLADVTGHDPARLEQIAERLLD
jgi:protein tyrosine/serine phosphatase